MNLAGSITPSVATVLALLAHQLLSLPPVVEAQEVTPPPAPSTPTPTPPSPTNVIIIREKTDSTFMIYIIVVIVLGCLLVSCIICGTLFYRKRKKEAQKEAEERRKARSERAKQPYASGPHRAGGSPGITASGENSYNLQNPSSASNSHNLASGNPVKRAVSPNTGTGTGTGSSEMTREQNEDTVAMQYSRSSRPSENSQRRLSDSDIRPGGNSATSASNDAQQGLSRRERHEQRLKEWAQSLPQPGSATTKPNNMKGFNSQNSMRKLNSAGFSSFRISRSDAKEAGHNRVFMERMEMIANGDYVRFKLLGKGSFGSVYQCVLGDGSHVAMKELAIPMLEAMASLSQYPTHSSGNSAEEDEEQCSEMDDFLNNVKSEVEIMMKCNHPNIIKVYGCHVVPREMKVLLFLELASGGSLQNLARNTPGYVTEDVARKLLTQIVSALSYIHSKGYVHRDVKCENMVLTQKGRVKIIDFGTATFVGETQNSLSFGANTIVGSPLFVAPEVLNGEYDEDPNGNDDDTKKGYGRTADVWSFGISAVELLNRGQTPWPNFSNQAQALTYISSPDSTPMIPKHLSPECISFLERCLVRDPKKRASMAELAVHPFLQPRSIQKRGTGLPKTSAARQSPTASSSGSSKGQSPTTKGIQPIPTAMNAMNPTSRDTESTEVGSMVASSPEHENYGKPPMSSPKSSQITTASEEPASPTETRASREQSTASVKSVAPIQQVVMDPSLWSVASMNEPPSFLLGQTPHMGATPFGASAANTSPNRSRVTPPPASSSVFAVPQSSADHAVSTASPPPSPSPQPNVMASKSSGVFPPSRQDTEPPDPLARTSSSSNLSELDRIRAERQEYQRQQQEEIDFNAAVARRNNSSTANAKTQQPQQQDEHETSAQSTGSLENLGLHFFPTPDNDNDEEVIHCLHTATASLPSKVAGGKSAVEKKKGGPLDSSSDLEKPNEDMMDLNKMHFADDDEEDQLDDDEDDEEEYNFFQRAHLDGNDDTNVAAAYLNSNCFGPVLMSMEVRSGQATPAKAQTRGGGTSIASDHSPPTPIFSPSNSVSCQGIIKKAKASGGEDDDNKSTGANSVSGSFNAKQQGKRARISKDVRYMHYSM